VQFRNTKRERERDNVMEIFLCNSGYTERLKEKGRIERRRKQCNGDFLCSSDIQYSIQKVRKRD
jgi:hypothetical protein